MDTPLKQKLDEFGGQLANVGPGRLGFRTAWFGVGVSSSFGSWFLVMVLADRLGSCRVTRPDTETRTHNRRHSTCHPQGHLRRLRHRLGHQLPPLCHHRVAPREAARRAAGAGLGGERLQPGKVHLLLQNSGEGPAGQPDGAFPHRNVCPMDSASCPTCACALALSLSGLCAIGAGGAMQGKHKGRGPWWPQDPPKPAATAETSQKTRLLKPAARWRSPSRPSPRACPP
jgi:hypothetical protein